MASVEREGGLVLFLEGLGSSNIQIWTGDFFAEQGYIGMESL